MRAEHPEQLVGKVEAVEKRERYTLYAITNRQDASKETMYEQVKQAILGGATCIQLREKNVDAALFLEEAIALEKICHEAGVLLIINDNVDIAIKSGADGVHVGQDDGSVREIRKRTGEQFIIGVTAKTVDQAKQAYEEGADYLGVGACFASPTKTDAKRITVQQLREIVDSVPIPVVAIGGITKENMVRLKGVRLAGLALVSAVFGATDIAAETKELRHKIQQLFG
ncbi:MAG: thiamine phosphate synthase [Eubacteriales bacterium]|nr:thiamine phosphate synthase [Eubacteriales bacterium]